MTIEHADNATSKARKIAIALLALAGLTVSGIVACMQPQATVPIYRWAIWLLPIIIAFTWVAGMAWARTSGPLIKMGDLQPADPGQLIYMIRITNARRIAVTPEVRLLSVQYLDGTPTEQCDHSWTVRKTSRQDLTSHDEHTDVPVLRHILNPAPNPATVTDEMALAAFVMADPNDLTRVTPFMRQSERKSFRVKISAFCGDGKIGNEVHKTFVLTPQRGWPGYEPKRERRWPWS